MPTLRRWTGYANSTRFRTDVINKLARRGHGKAIVVPAHDGRGGLLGGLDQLSELVVGDASIRHGRWLLLAHRVERPLRD
jgi:hypothetical protein